MWVRAGIGLATGVVIGAISGWVVAREETVELPAPPVAPCEDELQEASNEVQRLADEARNLSRQVDHSRRRHAGVRGMERPFPDEPPPALTADAIEAHLDEVLAGSSATLEELDCAAYPCVAVMRWEVPEIERDLVDAGDGYANLSGALLARLAQGPYQGLPHFESGRLLDGVEESVHAFAWIDPADYREAKQGDPDEVAVEGSVVDAAQGRTERVLERWLDVNDEEAP